jgi:glycosyltransferase EpsF
VLLEQIAKKPTRILHVVETMNIGGIETLIMNMFRKMKKNDVVFDFILHTDSETDFENEIQELGGRIYRLPKPNMQNLFSYYIALRTLMRKNGPYQAIHSHTHYFSGIPLLAANREKITARIAHSHTARDLNPSASWIRSFYKALMKGLIYKYSTHQLSCSKSANNALFFKGTKSKSYIVPNGLDLSVFREEDRSQKVDARTAYGLPKQGYIIGHIGSFNIIKNQSFIIDVFFEIVQRNSNAYLVLAGEGELREKIRKKATDLGIDKHVIFIDKHKNILNLYHAFDVFVFPSLFEGLGNVVIEAQAAGIPCVISNSVPSEADLKLGMVTFLTLEKKEWVDRLADKPNGIPVIWAKRKDALIKNGYNIDDVIDRIGEIYLHGNQTKGRIK